MSTFFLILFSFFYLGHFILGVVSLHNITRVVCTFIGLVIMTILRGVTVSMKGFCCVSAKIPLTADLIGYPLKEIFHIGPGIVLVN